MTLSNSFEISAEGLAAQSERLKIHANNVANINTPNYVRKIPVLTENFQMSFTDVIAGMRNGVLNAGVTYGPGGVSFAGVVTDPTPGKRVYEPGHPEADKDGYVTLSNVNVMADMADAMQTSRLYEANLAVVERDLIAGKILNLPAYLMAALREDYRSTLHPSTPLPALSRPMLAVADGEPSVPESKPLCLSLEAARLQEALDRLTPAERAVLEIDYAAHLAEGKGFEAQLLLKLYRKSGLNSKIVESHFRAFARAQLLGALDAAEPVARAALQDGDDPGERNNGQLDGEKSHEAYLKR